MREATSQDIIGLWIRLWRRTTVDEVTGCWTWTGGLIQGYGQTDFLGHHYRLHRLAKIVFDETFDQALTLDHLCRNRACWRLDHLEPCTMRTNVLRSTSVSAKNAVKTHCKYGHELSGDNVIAVPTGRQCRTCAKRRSRESEERRTARRRAARVERPPRTHCVNGHELTPDNIDTPESRRCLVCKRERNRQWMREYNRNVRGPLRAEAREAKPPRTHCVHGYELTPDDPNRAVMSGCKACIRLKAHDEIKRRYRARRKARNTPTT